MMPEIKYSYFENPQLLANVKSLVGRWAKFLPSDLRRLNVMSSINGNGDEGAVALVELSYQEYQSLNLRIFPQFFDMTEEDQTETILHELVHIQQAEVLEFVRRQLIEPIEERNPELCNFAEREFRERFERFTQNMTFAILRVVDAKETKARQSHETIGDFTVCADCGGRPETADMISDEVGGGFRCVPCYQKFQANGRKTPSARPAKCGGCGGSFPVDEIFTGADNLYCRSCYQDWQEKH